MIKQSIMKTLKVQGMSAYELGKKTDNITGIYRLIERDMKVSTLIDLCDAMDCQLAFVSKKGKGAVAVGRDK